MKVLLIELWGLGDATLATTAIHRLLDESHEVAVLCKPGSVALLSTTYPNVHFYPLTAPWTAFRGKYQFWKWPWITLFRLIHTLRMERFDLSASWRADPRDHFLMWLVAAKKRIGRPRKGSGIFLTSKVEISNPRHVVDYWRAILESSGISPLAAGPYLSVKLNSNRPETLSTFVLHCGAQQAVRRWPIFHLRGLIKRLRKAYQFRLVLIPDPDGFGQELKEMADEVLQNLTLDQLVSTLANATVVFANDSAPAHIAAAVGSPVIAFFGPQLPEYFAPFGSHNHVVIRDICPFRPCSDYCRYAAPICMTKLTAEEVWPEIHTHIEKLIHSEVLSKQLRKTSTAT